MFGRLVQKELMHHLLDFRFIAVFALCALLSALSAYMGGRNYVRQAQDYATVSNTNREDLKNWLDKAFGEFVAVGYRWSRKPEILSPIVYGLSGNLNQDMNLQFERPPEFEGSFFEIDPVYALFGVLDLSFIVEVVLSLAVLLFTYDAICGEKESGTLRLYASFPIARSKLALAKLVGSTVVVLVPFIFSYLLAILVLTLSPELGLQGDDWLRIVALMGIFALYLIVFAAFGLLVSALTHRRMTAFLGLLGLWAVWIFVSPNLAVRAVRNISPVMGVYDLERQAAESRWEIREGKEKDIRDYWNRNPVKDWNALPEALQRKLLEGQKKIVVRWNAELFPRLAHLQAERRNQMRCQQRLSMWLSSVSPLGPVRYASMDLARTGFIQQERIEDEMNAHLVYLAGYLQEKRYQPDQSRIVTDFSPFTYQDRETAGECLPRNVFHILNLALLSVLGFAGAYVAILRYDVR